MENTDWNWFFSSVAQSAAAIVGIFGAFIVTKILSNQSAFAEKSRRIQELVATSQKISDASGRLSFDWYHRRMNEEKFQMLEDLLEKDASLEPEALYQSLIFSPYQPRAEMLDKIAQAKMLREQRLEREWKQAKQSSEQARQFGISSFPPGINSSLLRRSCIPTTHLTPGLSREREEIDAMYTEARHQVRLVSDFYEVVATNPESSEVITWSLALILMLFFVGVIYPLSFLPLPTNWNPVLSLSGVFTFWLSLRGAILASVSLIFTTMLTIFFVMNVRLRYPSVLLNQLGAFKQIGAHSKFFENREMNATTYRPASEQELTNQ